jgi:transcriptional regulator with XRE-family HTH domain
MATLTVIKIDDLKAAIREAGLSQLQVAAATGIDQGQISRYVAGKVEPSPRNAMKLAEVLGLVAERRQSGKVQVTHRG